MADTHPSTAHYDARGQYQHDPDNQLLAEQHKLGLTQPQDIGPLVHPTCTKGYCEHLVLGGCPRD